MSRQRSEHIYTNDSNQVADDSEQVKEDIYMNSALIFNADDDENDKDTHLLVQIPPAPLSPPPPPPNAMSEDDDDDEEEEEAATSTTPEKSVASCSAANFYLNMHTTMDDKRLSLQETPALPKLPISLVYRQTIATTNSQPTNAIVIDPFQCNFRTAYNNNNNLCPSTPQSQAQSASCPSVVTPNNTTNTTSDATNITPPVTLRCHTNQGKQAQNRQLNWLNYLIPPQNYTTQIVPNSPKQIRDYYYLR